MIRVNGAKGSGYLYYFVPDWDDLNKVVSSRQIKVSDYSEKTWDVSKKLDKDSDHNARFISTTRNPYTLIDVDRSKGFARWNYAVILDKARLTDNNLIKPIDFLMKPDRYTVYCFELNDGRCFGALTGEGAYTFSGVSKLSRNEFEELRTWGKDAYEADDFLEDDPDTLDEILGGYRNAFTEVFSEKLNILFAINEVKSWFMFTFGLGTEEMARKDPGSFVQPKDVPKVIRKFTPGVTVSEDRLYPKPKEQFISIKNALVGILIPDIDYFESEERIFFEKKYPDIPIYIYHEKASDYHSNEEVQRYLRLNPEVRNLYRLPR